AEIAVAEREVVRTGRHRRLGLGPGDSRDGDRMELVVVGEEGEHGVGVHDLGPEHGAVPAHQLLEARGATHDVRELPRLRHATIRGEPTLPIVCSAHDFSFVLRKTPRSSRARMSTMKSSRVRAAVASIPRLSFASAVTSNRWLPAPRMRKSNRSGRTSDAMNPPR